MPSWIMKYLTAALGKKIGWALVRWYVKSSKNKVDDHILTIRDKIVKGDLDNLEKDIEALMDEASKLWADKKDG